MFSTLAVASVLISLAICQNTTSNSTTDDNLRTSSYVSSSTASTVSSGNGSCSSLTTCESCLKNRECYFCQSSNKCILYTVKDLIPTDQCGVKSVYYYTCKVSVLTISILGGVAIGLLLIAFIICCCCCCCKKGGRMKLSKDDLKWMRQREERKAKAEERRKERAEKTLEIRRKYGLFKDDSPYQRFDT